MTKQELLEKLNNIEKPVEGILRDSEDWHFEADDLLLEYINDEEIKEAYRNIEKWYA